MIRANRAWEFIRLLAPEGEEGGDGSGGEGDGGGEGDPDAKIFDEGDEGGGSSDDDKKPKADDKSAKSGSEDGKDKKSDDDSKDEPDSDLGKYELSDFEVPEGMSMDEEMFGELRESELGQKLSKEDVTNLFGILGQIREAEAKAVIDSHNERVEKNQSEWAKSETVEGIEVAEGEGGTKLEHANNMAITAATQLFPDVPAEAWNTTGFGSEPGVLKGLVRLYKVLNLGEGSPDGGGEPKREQSKKSRAEKLFPKVAATQATS